VRASRDDHPVQAFRLAKAVQGGGHVARRVAVSDGAAQLGLVQVARVVGQ